MNFGAPLKDGGERWTLKEKECGEGESDGEEPVQKLPLLY